MGRPWYKDLDRYRLAADMTISDLAVWLDRPRETVNSWLCKGRSPIYDPPARRRELERRIALLHYCVANNMGLPVPPATKLRDRASYVRGVYTEAARKLSRDDSALNRASLHHHHNGAKG